MNNRIVKIRCVNHKCKTFNSPEDTFCHRCSTPVVKNYLLMKGNLSLQYQVGEMINNRFLLYYPQIALDTKPDQINPTPEFIPNEIKAYLQVFSHRLHLPQIYDYISFPEQIWFLEYESVPLNAKGQLIYPKFFPLLASCLPKVSPLRQLNWLWQILQLWTPLARIEALSSLFLYDNIRVNGSIVKLLELRLDEELKPSLPYLGELWLNWLPHFDPAISNIIQKIALSLQQNLFSNIEEVINVLDQIINQIFNK